MGVEAFDDFFDFGDEEETSQWDAGGAAVQAPPRLGLLADLTTQQFDVIARSAQLKHVPGDAAIFVQGDIADRFFILVDGTVEVVRDDDVIATLGAGAFFGESALIVGGRRSATVRTAEPASIWSVGYEAFQQVMSGHLQQHEEAADEITRRIEQAPPESFR